MRIKRLIPALILTAALLCSAFAATAYAAEPYRVVIDDMADLFTPEQEKLLEKELSGVLPYGNAAVVTRSVHSYESTASMAENMYSWYFGADSGTVFAIDMQFRNIYIYSDGDIYRIINKARANEITDNTYTLASRGEYYACASKTFGQITSLLEGGRIFTPMKYVTYLMISFGLAMMICIIIVLAQRTLPKLLKDKEGHDIDGIKTDLPLTVRVKFITDKVTTRSSGGGRAGGGGGGGGGGGHGF